MSRVRVAAVLGVIAVLAVLATAVVAATTYVGGDEPADADDPPASTRTVTDPGSGAAFEVPSAGWRIRDARTRIYYDDERGHAVAVVRGPAVFRDGYCAASPDGSNRAFAGFTRQPLAAWVRGVTEGVRHVSTGVDRSRVDLADGRSASLLRAGLLLRDDGDACSAGAVEIAMVRAGDVRVVLVRDDQESGALPRESVEPILTSLHLE